MTTIAALQCVDKGLLHLDEKVSSILPEFEHPDILVSFDSETGQPHFKKANNKITLRQLLTHSSGMGYGFTSTKLVRWRKWVENDPESFKGNLVSCATPWMEEMSDQSPTTRRNSSTCHSSTTPAKDGNTASASTGQVRWSSESMVEYDWATT